MFRSVVALLLLSFMSVPAAGESYEINADFTGENPPQRANRDVPFVADFSNSDGISFEVFVEDREQFSSFSFYYGFEGAPEWLYITFDPVVSGEWVKIEKPFAEMDEKKLKQYDFAKVKRIRFSGWRYGKGKTRMAVRNISVMPKGSYKVPSTEELAARAKSANDAAIENLKRVPPKAGERRMIWAHNCIGLWGKTWDETVALAKAAGTTDIIANLAWGPEASYHSSVLTYAAKRAQNRDCLVEALEACHRAGLKLHVWNVCFRTWNTAPEKMAEFREKGWFQASLDGKVDEHHLCPSHPEVRKMLVDSMVELAAKGVDGIHFDYIRYESSSYCRCDHCREMFEAKIGRKVEAWPEGFTKDAQLAKAWTLFRKGLIDDCVRETAEIVRARYPKVEISAAVFTNPSYDVSAIGQDFGEWSHRGWIDFACPMTYTGTEIALKRQLARCREVVPETFPLYPGLGLGVWKDNGDFVARLADQIRGVRELNAPGYSIFELSRRFEKVVMESPRADELRAAMNPAK